jgi:hypothetical protein
MRSDVGDGLEISFAAAREQAADVGLAAGANECDGTGPRIAKDQQRAPGRSSRLHELPFVGAHRSSRHEGRCEQRANAAEPA